MNASELAHEAARLAATHTLSKDVIDLLKEKLSLLEEKVEQLEKENAQLKKKVPKSKPSEYVENMGVLWKRSGSGYENIPYCKDCPTNPIMMNFAGQWLCGNTKHIAPLAVRPPA
jgi:hypothetical protein